MKLPEQPPGASQTGIERRVEVQADGGIRVRETVTLAGVAAAVMRGQFKEMDRARHSEWAQSFLAGGVKGAKLSSFQVSGVEDNAAPIKMDFSYEVKDWARKSDGRLSLRLPDNWERDYLAVQPMTRRHPFRLVCPVHVQSAVTVVPPPGFAIEPPPAATKEGKGPWGRWQSAVEAGTESCVLRLTADLSIGTFPAEQYSQYHESMEQALGAVAPELRCKPIKGK